MLKFLCYITPNVTTLHRREVERDSPRTDQTEGGKYR